MCLRHSKFPKENPYLKCVSSHFLTSAVELHLVRFGLGASFTFELHCSSPPTPSLLLFRFTQENMLLCLPWIVAALKITYTILFCSSVAYVKFERDRRLQYA